MFFHGIQAVVNILAALVCYLRGLSLRNLEQLGAGSMPMTESVDDVDVLTQQDEALFPMSASARMMAAARVFLFAGFVVFCLGGSLCLMFLKAR